MEKVTAGKTKRVLEIATDVLYQWKNLVPTYEERITRIDGIHMENVTCNSAEVLLLLNGDPDQPIRNVYMKDIRVDEITSFAEQVNNVENIVRENVIYLHEK